MVLTDGDYDDDGVPDDEDGMLDSWETEHKLNPLIDNANIDTDGDGAGNYLEYIRGTDPQNPESYPSRSMPWLPLLLWDE